MGQYYHPFLIGEHGKYHIINPHHYNNGLKLMEHSYIGNYVTNAVRTLIVERPMRVAWIGDYSVAPYTDAYSRKLPFEKFRRYYKASWDAIPKYDHPSEFDYDETHTGWYLVNHTQKCFIDMDAYNTASGYTESGYFLIVDPLPLLTACGNDRGGGDFRKGYVGYKDVGIWAFDMIGFTSINPGEWGYEKKEFRFMERSE